MGAIQSIVKKQSPYDKCSPCPQVRISKKQRFLGGESQQLLPGVPDEVALQILARLPRAGFSSFQLVSKSWHDAFISNEIYDVRKTVQSSEEWLYVLIRDDEDNLSWHAVDPETGDWQQVPPMPESLPEQEQDTDSYLHGWWGYSSSKITEIFKGLFRWKGAVGKSPLCGCAAGASGGCLYVLGGFSRAHAVRTVWCYDPRNNSWKEVAPMGTPRAYCKTAVLNNKLYALGGVNKGTNGLMPLQSAEVYDPAMDIWRPIPDMPFTKAQGLPSAILADMLKPIATGIASYGGKLCVPQSLYSWPFFVDVGGEVFDPLSESWIEMPRGMGEGWPAKQAGTKLSVVVNGTLYALDPASSLDGSKIKVYDRDTDAWKVVFKKVPIVLDFSDSESPYLLAGLKNKLHLVTKDINDNIVVLQADNDNKSPDTSSVSTISSSAVASTNESSSLSEMEGWKVIAQKRFGAVELVACQVLEVCAILENAIAFCVLERCFGTASALHQLSA